jgi:hypothetical protein
MSVSSYWSFSLWLSHQNPICVPPLPNARYIRWNVISIAQALRRCLLTAKSWVQSQVTLCEIRCARRDTGVRFSCQSLFRHCSILICNVCDSLDQAARYHIFGLGWLQCREKGICLPSWLILQSWRWWTFTGANG